MIFRSQRVIVVRLSRVTDIYYFCAFFDLALPYFRINNSQVRLLSHIILTSCIQLRSKSLSHDTMFVLFRASVEMVATPPIKTSVNVIVVIIIFSKVS